MKKWFILDQALSGQSSDLYVLETEDGHIISSTPLDASFKKVEQVRVPSQTDFQARNAGLVDPSRLQEHRILIIGVGSGGSKTATSLVRSGAINLTLVDFDRVEVSNLCRSEYELPDVGELKVEALKRRLLRINPMARIEVISKNLHEMSRTEVEELIAGHDLCFECTDDPKTKLIINAVAYDQIPVIYPAVYDGGKGARCSTPCPASRPVISASWARFFRR